MKRTRILTISSCLAALVCFIIIRAANSYSQTRSASAEKNIAIKNVSSFRFGVAVDPDSLIRNPDYRKIVKTQFSSITPANFMKMNRLEPQNGVFKYDGADAIVKFALANNQRVHGHCLVWYKALPKWVDNFQGDSTAWEQLLKKYITTVVTHFKGQVSSWDVVNEAFKLDGTCQQTIWYKHLGKKYIARCFEYAHAADPKATLFYNDYYQEVSAAKNNAILNLVHNLKSKNVPINGLGLQMHTSLGRNNTDIQNGIKMMASSGLLIHISELTIAVNGKKAADFTETPYITMKQMQKFADVITMYKKIVPKAQQYGITVWNVGDKDTYYTAECKCPDFPQMFDTNYKKKDYFYKVIDALKQ